VEPIAIVGIGCRFPGASNPEAFWQVLRNGVDAIAEVPPERWDIDAFYDPNPKVPGKMSTRWGGFIEPRADLFDAYFFGISPREAERMDPQQRLALEVAWEALEDAALAPETLAGTPAGVFIGISHSDYDRLIYKDLSRLNAFNGTGSYYCIAANRISFLLNLLGPSMAIDTACSSSLVAVHLACQSLRLGESSLALAGGVNMNLSPEETIALSKARTMAADGRCKVFDARADGYVRGEGCGIVILKRLEDAVRDGNAIRAVIRGSAVNQDGLSNGLTAPNGLAQQAVIRQALENAGLTPAQVSYVEAHGSGTPLGDPIEMKALKAVLLEDRPADHVCWIGSAKTNIGHLEAAAGIAGLIKTVLALQHGEIPPHLHLKQLSPYISLEGTPIRIPVEREPWVTPAERRIAGVSGFGFGGANCHVVLEEAERPAPAGNQMDRPLHLLTLSAKSEAALLQLAERYDAYLAEHRDSALADICFTANTGRFHGEYRLAAIAESHEQLRASLQSFIAKREDGNSVTGKVQSKKPPTVGFLSTGEDSLALKLWKQWGIEPDVVASASSKPPDEDRNIVWVDVGPEYSDWRSLLVNLAQLYVHGVRVDWAGFDRDYRRYPLALPTYPFQRQRHWVDS
jgi:acyl transferase domain-containing protein